MSILQIFCIPFVNYFFVRVYSGEEGELGIGRDGIRKRIHCVNI